MSLAGKTGRHWALGPGHWSGGRKATSPRPKSPTPKAQRLKPAFSLAELMVAIGILGVGMLIIAAAFPVAIDQSRQAMELYTSKMVFDEAVLRLRTQVQWTELERYIDTTLAPNDRPSQDFYNLVPSTSSPVWLLRCDNVLAQNGSTEINPFQNARDSTTCVYSADPTYGWIAAFQKLSDRCFKFWVFVLREPTGILTTDPTPQYKFIWYCISDTTPTATQRIVFSGLVAGQPVNNLELRLNNGHFALRWGTRNINVLPPTRGSSLLADTGQLYKITDVGTIDGTDLPIMCDRAVADGAGGTVEDVTTIAYPVPNPDIANATVTRKDPVVAIYQTVISY